MRIFGPKIKPNDAIPIQMKLRKTKYSNSTIGGSYISNRVTAAIQEKPFHDIQAKPIQTNQQLKFQTSKRTNQTERNGMEWNRIDRYICTTKRANIKRNQIKLSLIKIKHNVSLAIVLGSVLICYILRAVLRCAISWIRFERKISSTSVRCNKNQ